MYQKWMRMSKMWTQMTTTVSELSPAALWLQPTEFPLMRTPAVCNCVLMTRAHLIGLSDIGHQGPVITAQHGTSSAQTSHHRKTSGAVPEAVQLHDLRAVAHSSTCCGQHISMTTIGTPGQARLLYMCRQHMIEMIAAGGPV